ncbi:polymer-forming cytoskeletal protein [Roseospira visakhapatnamensis]|uniref:Cytoskeletal protein CcmA (Bactofilin family) n=1 Tax=Roseospira visakhapatnamensis TaxID=390880 RepID=A0A7W6W900_9PROT|nr:polymer-forming cytoskeletal protein [Roseospira visakhapatnamensis]MBB4265384.1 cytoskeletal protein CcmA (bactofilin family) [Roseospira visakhapatnamensis]
MAFFNSPQQGRPSGGVQGSVDGDRVEASGDGKGGGFQPPDTGPVSSPSFKPGVPVKPQTGAYRPEPPLHGRTETPKSPSPDSEPASLSPPGLTPAPSVGRDSGEAKNLIVGRGIQLNGQISACDRLVVEGTVEADLNDAEAIEVAESGLFRGTASIQEADISGRFEGNLIVKRRLTLRAGGRIEGNVQYAAIVVEEGGQIRGQMDVLGGTASGD